MKPGKPRKPGKPEKPIKPVRRRKSARLKLRKPELIKSFHGIFFDPERRKLKSQVHVTAEVRKFVAGLKPTEKDVKRLIDKMLTEINFAILLRKTALPLYNEQTAHEILKYKLIPVEGVPAGPFEGAPIPIIKRGYPSWGCLSQATALYAGLKAMGVKKVRHYRGPNDLGKPHSFLDLEAERKRFLADLFYGGTTSFLGRPLVKWNKRIEETVRKLKNLKVWWPIPLNVPMKKKYGFELYTTEDEALGKKRDEIIKAINDIYLKYRFGLRF